MIDVLRYMGHYGLPDESCMPYSATDHTKYGRHATRCPAEGYCTNCMPIDDVDTCWPVKTPIRYYVVRASSAGSQRAGEVSFFCRHCGHLWKVQPACMQSPLTHVTVSPFRDARRSRTGGFPRRGSVP